MIVVDSNVLAYFYLPTELSGQAAALRVADPVWIAPRLWRSEMRSVLSLYVRKGQLTLTQAQRIQDAAESLLADREFEVPSFEVLQLASESGCSAYDCEFVALAKEYGIRLATADKQLLASFPGIAVTMEEAAA